MNRAETILNSARLASFTAPSVTTEEAIELGAYLDKPLAEQVKEMKSIARRHAWVPVFVGVTGLAWIAIGSYLTRKRRRK